MSQLAGVGYSVAKARLFSATGGHTHPLAEKYAERMCGALASALSIWQLSATMKDIKIVSAAAVGTQGCVQGPGLGGIISSLSFFSSDPDERKLSVAIASPLGSAWQSYITSIMVPGRPWYPSFAMYPGPQAPPTPNIPCKLIELPQSEAVLSPALLMPLALAQAGGVTGAAVFVDAILSGFYSMFTVWRLKVRVTNVMGKGPVPSYAPPAVRAGPVVGGEGNMTPGGFV